MNIDIVKGTANFTSGSRDVINFTGNASFIGESTLCFVAGQPLPIQAIEGEGSTFRLLDPFEGNSGTYNVTLANTLEGLANAIKRIKAGVADTLTLKSALQEVIESTSPTVTIELSDGEEITVVPWGYLKGKFETESSDLLTEFEDDLKRNRILALAGMVL